jgi:hypothetical protein
MPDTLKTSMRVCTVTAAFNWKTKEVMDKHESKDMQNVNASWIYFEYPALSGQCIYDIHTSNAADVKPSS